MGDRALPRVNKLMHQRELQVRRKRHEDRVRRVKSTINNLPPTRYSHLTNQKKKKQMQLERMAKIERENLYLLEKLRRVMVEPQVNVNEPFLKGSLNRETRKRDMIRIMEENESLLRRIQAKKPFYRTDELEKNHQYNEKLLSNIGEFPYQPNTSAFRKSRRTKSVQRLPAPRPELYRTCVFSQLNIEISGVESTLSVYELNEPFRLEFVAMDSQRRSSKTPVRMTFEHLYNRFGEESDLMQPENTNGLVYAILADLYFEEVGENGGLQLRYEPSEGAEGEESPTQSSGSSPQPTSSSSSPSSSSSSSSQPEQAPSAAAEKPPDPNESSESSDDEGVAI